MVWEYPKKLGGKGFARELAVFAILMCFVNAGFLIQGRAMAEQGQSGSVKTNYNCNNTNTFTTNVCKDKTGGASWHIFKTYPNDNNHVWKLYKLYKSGPRYCQSISGYKKSNCKRIIGLTRSAGGVQYDKNLTNECPKYGSNGKPAYSYYLAFVYDGVHGNDNQSPTGTPKKHNNPTYWGPLAWNVPLSGSNGKTYTVSINHYYEKKTADILDAINKDPSESVHTWKVYSNRTTGGSAMTFYKSLHRKASSIPKTTGYFCAVFRKLKVYAVNENTGDFISKKYKNNPIRKRTVLRYMKATVNPMPTKIGDFVYTGKICKTKDGQNCKKATGKYSIAEITKDEVRYAMYGGIPVTEEMSKLSLDVGIKKTNPETNVTNEVDYQEVAYAKPGDKISYRLTYYPDAISTYYEKASSVKVNGTVVKSGNNLTVGSSWSSWENKIGVSPIWNETVSFNKDVAIPNPAITYSNSGKCVRTDCMVVESDVGKKITEKAAISANTPGKVVIGNGEANITPGPNANSDDPDYPLTDEADVIVPYNFEMEPGASVDGILYAGEKTTMDATWKVGEKTNSYVTNYDGSEASYATKVSNIAVKTVVFMPNGNQIDESWDEDEEGSDTSAYVDSGEDLGDDGSGSSPDDVVDEGDDDDDDDGDGTSTDGGGTSAGDGSSDESFEIIGGRDIDDDNAFCTVFGVGVDYCDVENIPLYDTTYSPQKEGGYSRKRDLSVPDVDAGSKICVATAVFPANNGEDDNYDGKEGYNGDYSGSWKVSKPVCYEVAKKPNLQVWGGNVYSNGRLKATEANKVNLAGYNNGRVFGSWGELGVISFNGVNGFGSGASLGYAENVSGGLWPTVNPSNGLGNNSGPRYGTVLPGGNDKLYSPLTIPNTNVNSSLTKISAAGERIAEDKIAVVSKYLSYKGGENVKNYNNLKLNDASNLKDNKRNVYYYYGKNDITISRQTVAKNTTQIVHSTKNIIVDDFIMYGSVYSNYSEMPKLVLYAEGDVNIKCNTGRIDALIIANKVNTCYDSDDINASKNSRQLKINGAIIANKVVANRTYGAATGANSMVPAEIFNFDPTLYLWNEEEDRNGNVATENDRGRQLEVTDLWEVAPRK